MKLSFKRARGRPPKVTLEQYVRIMSVGEARDAIPSDKELATELGVSLGLVRAVMKRHRKADAP